MKIQIEIEIEVNADLTVNATEDLIAKVTRAADLARRKWTLSKQTYHLTGMVNLMSTFQAKKSGIPFSL